MEIGKIRELASPLKNYQFKVSFGDSEIEKMMQFRTSNVSFKDDGEQYLELSFIEGLDCSVQDYFFKWMHEGGDEEVRLIKLETLNGDYDIVNASELNYYLMSYEFSMDVSKSDAVVITAKLMAAEY